MTSACPIVPSFEATRVTGPALIVGDAGTIAYSLSENVIVIVEGAAVGAADVVRVVCGPADALAGPPAAPQAVTPHAKALTISRTSAGRMPAGRSAATA